MTLPRRRQGPHQMSRRVFIGSPRRDRVSENSTAVLQGPLGRLQFGPRLHALQTGQNVSGAELCDRPSADPRENIQLQPPYDLAGMTLLPIRGEFPEPLARDCLETIPGRVF